MQIDKLPGTDVIMIIKVMTDDQLARLNGLQQLFILKTDLKGLSHNTTTHFRYLLDYSSLMAAQSRLIRLNPKSPSDASLHFMF